MATEIVNHVGLCVTDLDRSARFYEHAFGFQEVFRFDAPDEPTGKLLGLDDKPGLTAVYLRLGDFILELLRYEIGTIPAPARVMNEPGLTHLSLGVDDLDDVIAKVRAGGGEVLDDTHIGVGVMVRDPDGQLLELITGWQRPGE